MPDDPMARLQGLLRELFQFDCQDLDFGIYRVLNYKRKQIEEFINERLRRIVDDAFAQYAAADKAAVERELEERRHEIVASMGATAFDATGQLVMAFRETPLGKQFIELEQKVKVGRVAVELKASVYNDLYTFFSRYYEEGDVFSKPRRGKVEIPFTGHEDVVLHWANKDQYYIKTGEQFKSYRFTVDKQAVQFALKDVSTEQNNNRGEKRYFVIVEESPVAFDDKTKTLTVSLGYRPLSNAEKKTYGKTEHQKPQDKLNAVAEEAILKRVNDATLKGRLAQPVGDDKPSLLLHHLTRFTKKNSTDFFIHKDLHGFLQRELEDFLKTEVLRVDELLAAGGTVAAQQLARGRVVREIAGQIIAFLAQVEDFQKRLFEKRKFVVQTEYCITLDRLPELMRDEVLKNEDQLNEWRELYAINKKKPHKNSLKEHKTLMVDTRHFPEDFKWRLLATFDDIDAELDGLLIKSENFQALSLLLAKYRERLNCIHIDPPYNTQTSGFLYKNEYQHSSWLAMMEDRIGLGLLLLCDAGAFVCHIDENEYEKLHLLCTRLGLPDGGTIVWDKKNPMLGRKGVATQHEYVLWRTSLDSPIYLRSANVQRILDKAKSIIQKHGGVNERSRREFTGWMNTCEGLTGGERAYRLIDGDGRVFRGVAMGAPEPRTNPKFHIPLIHPVTKKKCPVPGNGWSRAPETLKKLIEKGEILFGEDETVQPQRIVFLTEESKRQLPSVISDASRGKNDLEKLGLEFPYCHPVSLYEELLGAGASEKHDIVLDHFAGSGTTAHAVINLNREDGGNRKYVLVDVENYFDTVMLPRIKKVVFCENWNDGKPAGGKGVSHFLKYELLEQYDDTLNNLQVVRAKGAELALKTFGDEYLLRYMLEFETQGSASLLAVEQLRHPFSYRLKVQDSDAVAERTLDLIETFNYLLGLHVKKLREFCDGKGLYRVTLGEARNGKSAVIVWRDLEGLEDNKDALQKDRLFIEKEILPALLGKGKKPDRLLVNGGCVVEGAEAIEPEFKRLMFAPVG